jgi:hypothetical protein
MKIRLSECGKFIATDDDKKSIEVASFPVNGKAAEYASNGPVVSSTPIEAPSVSTQKAASGGVKTTVMPTPEYPFAVYLFGVYAFCSKNKAPERLEKMLINGMDPAVVVVIDTRTGEAFGIKKEGK